MAHHPLTTVQLKQLRSTLTPDAENTEEGDLRGKTYAEMAIIFGKKIGREVSARQIRHYVNILRADEKNTLLYVPQAGAPKGPRRGKQAQQSNILGALGNELRVLTGLTASALYAVLGKTKGDQALFGSRATFHNRLKHPSWEVTPSVIPTPRTHTIERDGFLKRCRLHIHVVHFELDPGRRYLAVMAGYEEVTGYIDFRFFEAHVEHEEPQHVIKKRGRPAKFEGPVKPEDTVEISVTTSPDAFRIEVSADTLSSFIDDMIAPLHLPVTRVLLRNSVSVAGGLESVQAKQSSRTLSTDDQPWHPYLPHQLPHTITPKALAKNLASWVRRYGDETVLTNIMNVRKKFNDELREAKKIRKHFGKKHTRREKRLLALKNACDTYTHAEKLIRNPCLYIQVPAVFKKSTEPQPDATAQTD